MDCLMSQEKGYPWNKSRKWERVWNSGILSETFRYPLNKTFVGLVYIAITQLLPPSPTKALFSKKTLISTTKCLWICHWLKVVWHSILQPSTSFSRWRLCHNKRPTSLWVQRIGIPLASAYPFCLKSEENMLHLLFQCPFPPRFWSWFCAQGRVQPVSVSFANIWSDISANSCRRFSLVLDALMVNLEG